jgi:hypothetical protein
MGITPILLIAATCALAGDRFPPIEAQSLDDRKIAFPAAAAGRPAVVVIGFTHASQNQTRPWGERLSRDPASLLVYSLAVLEDVPRLVRGMAAHGIKSGVPKEQRERFLLVYHDEKALKEIAGFSQPDDAYVLLLDGSGAVSWKYHGPVSDGAITELGDRLASLDH